MNKEIKLSQRQAYKLWRVAIEIDIEDRVIVDLFDIAFPGGVAGKAYIAWANNEKKKADLSKDLTEK